jgi:polysaccharide deacetylase 2 family uncharacterized protein YibQ
VAPFEPRRRRAHDGHRAGNQAERRGGAASAAGQLALVIDDLRRGVDDVKALDALGVPLSYSVLPFEAETPTVVARLRAEHREILCHLTIRAQLARFLARSRERGAAIAIVHPRPTTLEVLREELPKAKAEGFTFVPVSFLLDRRWQPL